VHTHTHIRSNPIWNNLWPDFTYVLANLMNCLFIVLVSTTQVQNSTGAKSEREP
jgi:hypothetical protein